MTNINRVARDFNFFDAYNRKAEHNQKRIVLLISLLIFVGIVAFCVLTVNYILELRIQVIQYEIDSVNLSIQESTGRLNRYDQLNDQLGNLTAYNDTVDLLSEQIEHSSYINTALMKSITDSMPKDIVISSLSVSSDTVTLSAAGESEQSIAEFEHNIRTLKHIGSVFVSGISGDAPVYNFTMSIKMKEVAVYEEKK